MKWERSMWGDIRAAFSFLTILPLGHVEGRKPSWSFAWYPLVGLGIGSILMVIARFSPFGSDITAFLVVLGWAILTGGLHLDGFGDSCDGLLATVSPERRLEIMKDPRTGTWAVAGLMLLLLGKWTMVATIAPIMFIVPPVIGRWGMVVAAYAFPYGRASGVGGYFRDGLGRVQIALATLSMVMIVALIGLATHPAVLALIPLAAIVIFGFGRWSAQRLGGGITGDIYGALCELLELLCLLGLSLWVSG
ncbi:MAG: adenosylcobinamide-GDP ribazoletransferase [Blastochloris sp.]|nr:adenosylcobinamide-GDP ribazoletransferase [Blastochloris sp.]